MRDSVNDPSRPTVAAGGSDPSPSGIRLPERWRPVRLLGRGGQADVWLAEDTELGEMVAVKVFREGLNEVGWERLRREVKLGRSLQHPGLVRMHELMDAGGRPAVVMEWVGGGSLAERLQRGSFPVVEAVAIAIQIVQALAHLHGRGVVHRDVKPSNLLLAGEERVKLADYGLVRFLEGGRDLTRTATTVGTPTYMSPEQVQGREPGPASDLYSLGVTLYEMLSGRPPFTGTSELQVAARHLEEIPEDLRLVRPDCPAWLGRFVMTLLEKRPADRLPDAAAALAVLQSGRAPWPRRMRRRGVHVVAGAAALTLLGLGAVTATAAWRAAGVVRVEARGWEVVGLDDRGRPAWRLALQQEVFEAVEADLTGDGIPETVVSAAADAGSLRQRADMERRGEVLVVTRRGRVLTRTFPEDLLRPWPFDYPKGMRCSLHPLPRTYTGERPVVVRCHHLEFFPSVIAVFWPVAAQWTVALVHSGWIRDVVPVSGGELPRIVAAGVNNRLGAISMVAMLELLPPELMRSAGLNEGWEGPGYTPEAARLLWYTGLDPGRGYPSAIADVSEDAVTLVGQGDHHWRVDLLGNPIDGPNQGLDLGRQRVALLHDLTRLLPSTLPWKYDDLLNFAEHIRGSCAQVLAEPVHSALLDLSLGRALTSLGRGGESRKLLRERIQHVRFPELVLHLAHLEALAGNVDEANRLLELPVQGFGRWFNHSQLQIRLAIAARDEDRFALLTARIMEGFMVQGIGEHRAVGLRTRVNLWWDRISIADTLAVSTGFEPAGTALACLARWRLGVTSSEDPGAMVTEAALNPDARLEYQVARAAAFLGLGRNSEALASLTTSTASLEVQARHDFSAHQLLQLAHALLVRALLGSGQPRQARVEAERLRPAMMDGLLPALIVDEVLAELQAVS